LFDRSPSGQSHHFQHDDNKKETSGAKKGKSRREEKRGSEGIHFYMGISNDWEKKGTASESKARDKKGKKKKKESIPSCLM